MHEIVNGNPRLRRTLYTVYAVVGLVVGSTQVGFSAAEASQPVALTVALAVYAYVGVAFGFAAQSKVDAAPVVIEDGTGRYRADPEVGGNAAP